LARNAFYRVSGMVMSIMLTLVTTPLLIAGFGLEGFGLWSIALAALGMSGVFDLGMGVATTRAVAGVAAHSKGGPALGAVLKASLVLFIGLGLAATLLLWLLSGRIAGAVGRDSLSGAVASQTLALAAFGAVPVFLRNWGVSVFNGLERYGVSTVLFLFPSALGIGGAAVGAYLGWDTAQAMRWNVGVLGCFALASVGAVTRATGRSWLIGTWPERAVLGGLVTFGTAAGVGGIAVRVFNVLDRVLVGVLLSAAAAGVYTAAIGIANKLYSLAQNFSHVLLPRTSALVSRDRKGEVRNLLLLALRLIASGTFALSLVLALNAEFLLRVWLGAETAALTTEPLKVLLLIYALIGAVAPSMHIANGLGRPWAYSSAMLGTAVASLGLLVWLAPRGVAWAAVANAGGVILIALPIYLAHHLEIEGAALARYFAAPVLLGVVGFVGVFGEVPWLAALATALLAAEIVVAVKSIRVELRTMP
jgi:O-antigen/teichoic acid export membrane protein